MAKLGATVAIVKMLDAIRWEIRAAAQLASHSGTYDATSWKEASHLWEKIDGMALEALGDASKADKEKGVGE